MITVKLKTVHGTIENFTTDKYMVSPVKDMHPDILDVKVYAGSKCIIHKKRHFQVIYKKFIYKPIQQELKPEDGNEDKKEA